jgi:hypothetical protein
MPPPRLLKKAKNDIKHDRANSRAIMTVNESPPLSSNGVFTTALIENIPTRTTSQKMVVDENGEIKKWEIYADFSKADFEMFKIYEKNGDLLDLQFIAPQLNSSIYTYTNNHPRQITINDAVYNKMKDRIFTHNHPRASSFSRNDLIMACESKLAGMEAVANTENFWNAIQSISNNKNKILTSLNDYKETYKKYGMNEYVQALSHMEDFVKDAKYNMQQPTVKFQITPKERTTIDKNGVSKKSVEWNPNFVNQKNALQAIERDFSTILVGLDLMSMDAKRLLIDHSITKHAANKLDFNYSISTHKD